MISVSGDANCGILLIVDDFLLVERPKAGKVMEKLKAKVEDTIILATQNSHLSFFQITTAKSVLNSYLWRTKLDSTEQSMSRKAERDSIIVYCTLLYIKNNNGKQPPGINEGNQENHTVSKSY